MSILPKDIITHALSPYLCHDPHTLLAMMKADPSLIPAFKHLGYIEHLTEIRCGRILCFTVSQDPSHIERCIRKLKRIFRIKKISVSFSHHHTFSITCKHLEDFLNGLSQIHTIHQFVFSSPAIIVHTNDLKPTCLTILGNPSRATSVMRCGMMHNGTLLHVTNIITH